jgi:predicted  nucleic acid-binding Zn-ribbon protein
LAIVLDEGSSVFPLTIQRGHAYFSGKDNIMCRLMRSLLVLIAWSVFAASEDAWAFDPRTHVWIGQQVLNDVVKNGNVTIDGKTYPVRPEIVQALKDYPDYYRMGHIGPDAHPDLIVGQMFLHPGIKGHWRADDWFKHVLDSAKKSGSSRNLAYAMGMWGHAAGDIMGHTYINTYAGDYFLILEKAPAGGLKKGATIDTEVEIRHFALEHYIGDHTPKLKDADNNRVGEFHEVIRVPADFLSDTFIHNNDAYNQYQYGQPFAGHLMAMHQVRRLVVDLRKRVDDLQNSVPQEIKDIDAARGKAQKVIDDALNEIASLQPIINMLALDIEALKKAAAVERAAAAPIEAAASEAARVLGAAEEKKRALDAELAGLDHQINSVLDQGIAVAQKAIDALEKTVAQAQTDLSAAKKRVESYLAEISRWQGEVNNLNRRIARAIQIGPLGRLLDRANDSLSRAQDGFTRANQNVVNLTDNLTAYANSKAQFAKDLASKQKDRADAVVRRVANQLDVKKIVDTLDALRKQAGQLSDPLQAARKAVAEKQRLVDEAILKLETLKHNLTVADQKRRDALDVLANLIRRSTLMDGLLGDLGDISTRLGDWDADIKTASEEYINAATKTLIKIILHDLDKLQPMRDWRDCWGPVFFGVPAGFARGECAVRAQYREIVDAAERAKERAQALLFQVLPITKLVQDFKDKMQQELLDAAVAIVERWLTDDVAQFYALHGPVTRDNLNKTFATDISGRQLRTFNNFVKIADSDMGMAEPNGVFDPTKFAAVQQAINLVKLTLLDADAINSIGPKYGLKGGTLYGPTLYPPMDPNFVNILYRAVKSIDGNQQWRGHGMPYFRKGDTWQTSKREDLDFGYCFKDDKTFGFRLWVDPDHRKKVFQAIFPNTRVPGITYPADYPSDDADDGCVGVFDPKTTPDPPREQIVPTFDSVRETELKQDTAAAIQGVYLIRLKDRVDQLTYDQVAELLKTRFRDEVISQLKEEAKQAELAKWSTDYGAALVRAKADKAPLLLIVEDGTDQDKQFAQTSAGSTLEDDLLKPYVRIRIDVKSTSGAKIARDLGSPKLPYLVVADPNTRKIIHRRSGQIDSETWMRTLLRYRHLPEPAMLWPCIPH